MTGPLDGITSSALAQYQGFHGLPVTGRPRRGHPGDNEPRSLLAAGPTRPLAAGLLFTCTWNRPALTYAFDAVTGDIAGDDAGDDERHGVRPPGVHHLVPRRHR
jgi:hypothetical protein